MDKKSKIIKALGNIMVYLVSALIIVGLVILLILAFELLYRVVLFFAGFHLVELTYA